MVRNKSEDLNNHLFAQMERLNDEDIKGDDLREEIERAKAIASISSQIVENAALAVKSTEVKAKYGLQDKDTSLPVLLE